MGQSYKAKYWKSKAVRRGADIKALKKRIEEITESRDNWKTKYKNATKGNGMQEKEASQKKRIKKNENKLNLPARPKNYKYSLLVIQFMIAAKMGTSISFRSLEKVIVILNLYFKLELGQPCYGTILVWVKKFGLYSLEKPKEKADDWILILDESISIGHEKLLVIYGIRASQIEFNRALKYNDLTPFLIKSSSSWTGEDIKQEIEKITGLYGKIKYVVADGGNAIRKSLELLSIIHIYDITHKIAWVLKKIYEKNPTFMKYTKKMKDMRYKGVCSTISYLIPPKQRVNSRFMNMDILSEWGIKALRILASSKKKSEEYEKLLWLKKYQSFITELNIINNAIANVQAIVKTKGLSQATLEEVTKILGNLDTNNERIESFHNEIMQYLKETKDKLSEEEKILCTSDIIESSFGKYKNSMSQNSIAGITNLALCLATFTSSLDADKLKEGLEATKMQDLKKWSKDFIGDTNLSRRRKVFHKNRGDKILHEIPQI